MNAAAPEEVFAPDTLHYVTDISPGVRRVRHARGFRYFDADGNPISDRAERRRIDALRIPPAWEHVWISPDPLGHILATGRDSKGRKQYIYHPAWHDMRSHDRFSALLDFSRTLPHMRATIDRHLRKSSLSRERVLALVVRLLETTLIRIGNREYAKENDSYGLTTLRRRHVRREGNQVRFTFRGKSGKEHSITLRDPRAANVLRRCEELPGQQIFQYRDDEGVCRSIQSQDVNEYLRALCGEDYTAKDLRTWGGTVVATTTLIASLGQEGGGDPVKAAVKAAAHALGNTVAVARRHYIHPAVLRAYEEGRLGKCVEQIARSREARHLSTEERVVISILRRERRGGRKRPVVRVHVPPAAELTAGAEVRQ